MTHSRNSDVLAAAQPRDAAKTKTRIKRINKKQKKALKPPGKVEARDFRAELPKPDEKIAVKFNHFRAGPCGAA